MAVADWAWSAVSKWDRFARDTIGGQLVRACDSIGANLVEGDGRGTDPDALRFFFVARASAREARYWIGCAQKRRLIPVDVAETKIAEITDATRALSGLIRYRRTHKLGNRVREADPPTYRAGVTSTNDPFNDELAP